MHNYSQIHRESEAALQDRIRELEKQLKSSGGTAAAPSALAVKLAGTAPPIAAPTTAPNPAAAPSAVHSVVQEMKGFTQINGNIYVEIIYVGNPKVNYVPLASAPKSKMLEDLVKRMTAEKKR
ncbi:hypothetical protein PRIPAC_87272 [Pristionchus pacificus]|uniref:Uncharacterized protein n=1 Tax=Pristionchus pacificus TaxID=54126 RepID=A0A2A6B5N4_PRIPA|nr:hypothetical protein PRIPAC_87272 [Pristionchus pacificus]|eukprot:PDM61182.1 hypothetical protein PRIPAC_50624 [Pristionchus pacificus]